MEAILPGQQAQVTCILNEIDVSVEVSDRKVTSLTKECGGDIHWASVLKVAHTGALGVRGDQVVTFTYICVAQYN